MRKTDSDNQRKESPYVCVRQREIVCVFVCVSLCVWVCVPLLYLSKPRLAVNDVGPFFAGQAVCKFVLPDKCSVFSTGAALQPSCTLGNNATHHLGHTKVHLQHRQTELLLLAHSLHHRNQSLSRAVVYCDFPYHMIN